MGQPSLPGVAPGQPAEMEDFMKRLYEHEGFQKEKQSMENQISQASEVTV